MLVSAGWAGAGKGVDPRGGTKSRGRLGEHLPFPHLVAVGRQCRYVSDASVARPRVFGQYAILRSGYDDEGENDDFSTATTGWVRYVCVRSE